MDRERGVWLRKVGSYSTSAIRAFQLQTPDRVFLLERLREQTPSGEYSAKIVHLGFSPIGSMRTGIKSDPFQSAADRTAIGLLAAEALLVFGGFYNGSPDPQTNRETIEFDGRIYTLSDLVS